MRITVSWTPEFEQTFHDRRDDIGATIQSVANRIIGSLGAEAFVRIDGVLRAYLRTVRTNDKVLVDYYFPNGTHCLVGACGKS